MKKIVKPLVIAASVAAIAGIGAVSFAAWSGSNVDGDATTSATMGNTSISAGFVVTNAGDPKTLDFGTGVTLMPVDQGSGTTMLTAALGDVQVVKGTYNFTLAADATTTLQLYYQVAESVTAPTITADTDTNVIAALGSDWIALGSSTTAVNVSDNVETVSDLNLYVILVSSSTDDMNASVNLTLTLNSTPDAT